MTDDWAALIEIPGTPTTRSSTGYGGHAAELQALVRDAHTYLSGALGTSFAPLVVVVTPDDWREGEEDVPYGIPYASDDELALVIPAEPDANPLVDTYAEFGTREEAARFADLIAVHELGHLHVREMGLELPQGWLGEFVATYLSYSFLSAHRPTDAELWLRLSREHADAATPAHRSLEDLDEVYFGVGPDNYIWYQNTLSVMVDAVHSQRGIHFALALRSASLTSESDTAATLAAAEAICPGFQKWADGLCG